MSHQHDHHRHNHNHHKHDHSHSALKNIRVAFLLNLGFAILEIVGGFFSGSYAIIADAVHDLGDSISLGLAFYLQKASSKPKDQNFSYGYGRLSLLSAVISGVVILTGSLFILIQVIIRWGQEYEVKSLYMLGFAILGLGVNSAAAFLLSRGSTMNERVLTWHLIEDVLGWAAILIGSIFIYFLKWHWIDSALALILSLFIMWNVMKNLWTTSKLFLQSVPEDIHLESFQKEIQSYSDVKEVHDLHVWSLDGEKHIMSIHVVVSDELSDADCGQLRNKIRHAAHHLGQFHVTIEIERFQQRCQL